MTPAASGTANLGAIVARTRYLLLDFDGPICSIFAGLPAPTVAEKLRKLIPADRLPDEIKHSSDPIDVFTYSATVSPELAERVEAKMADLEVAATATATPTPYVHEVMASCRKTSRIIGVVSNNSTRAVTAYLDRHDLADYVALVIGRTNPDPALLKPSPHLIETVINGLQADRAASALVGDSVTDVEAAHHAGIASIGYANKPGKRDRMTQARAESVINSMADLALSLRSRHLRDLRSNASQLVRSEIEIPRSFAAFSHLGADRTTGFLAWAVVTRSFVPVSAIVPPVGAASGGTRSPSSLCVARHA